ncbi:ATP-dependent DNA helicase chl1 [Pseudocercospora fuligena]|uniref:ATP-dependent DNA helicase CHL1 n=1 Tax=Pseudocercospora fuligena TaxID=685502 RepID=A0A8H6R5H8_9PEZI|nr:ATP-dependent DNA helicase chl1 [Pseudocercospora fuligena]
MVLLTITAPAKAAIDEFCRLKSSSDRGDESDDERVEQLSKAEIGSPIEHQELIDLSKYLVAHDRGSDQDAKKWRLDTLLKGASVYRPPPPPKPEPTSEYKALMQRLRKQEEQREYERMINPPPKLETFSQRFPNAAQSFGPSYNTADEVDEVTYSDVNRQMILIINVLISIICTSVAVWMAARRWNVVPRMLLAFVGSTVVAVAEVAIYMGYIKRIGDAKTKERKAIEKKEILDTWIIDGKSTSQQTNVSDSVRFRKGKGGKHRKHRHHEQIVLGEMAPKEFHHPFQPYDIQQQFMEALYDCIEHKQVGIFESPTGTGKSLSLICGALTWLREHKRKTFDEALAKVEVDDDEPDWMTQHAREARSREIRQMRTEFEARLCAVRERERKVKERAAKEERPFKRQKASKTETEDVAEEEQFVLEDYESDDEIKPAGISQYSTETTKLMEKLGLLPKSGEAQAKEEDLEELKVVFCSRTHSQLSQFVGELKRVSLPPGLPPEDNPGEQALKVTEEVKHLTLGSRKNLCINPKVNKLSSQTAINERCIELQQSNTAADKKCSFLPNKDQQDLVLDFRDHALSRIRDIEDLAKLGSKLELCPYFASRAGIGPAEMVTLPYPLLLQKSAREALGISLKRHVVVIDEAHNLMNAVEGIYSARITEAQLRRAKKGLITYLQKFRNRLKGSNRTYVTQIVRVIDSLLSFLAGVKDQNISGNVTSPSALLAGKAVDQINLAKLVRYVDESKLARKVEGYIAFVAQSDTTTKKEPSIQPAVSDVPTLMHLQSFLLCLMNPSKEGRFLWTKENGDAEIQYLLLDPSASFRDIVEEARAVILAGGTMSPMEDYKQQLFPYLTNEITTFSCGHLIPPSSLFVRTISSDNQGRLDFTFKSRNENTTKRLGSALIKIASKVQGGMIVFFPSYTYLETVLQTWTSQSLTPQLEALKPLFFDSRTVSAEETFRSYTQAIHTNPTRGALLLSVIGGKLSEGINFSDDLGRCVVVVGLPYPNLQSPDFKAKMEYLEEKQGKGGSREYAENLCMRAVNQAIGRVIRHKGDWASILLFDDRFEDVRIKKKLPGWIREGMVNEGSGSGRVEDVVEGLGGFFDEKMGK